MCICKLRVLGHRRQWEMNSPFSQIASDFACNLQGAKRLLAPALSYGLACLPQLGLLNTTAWAASPPRFSSTFIISYIRPAHSSHPAIIHAACINLTVILIDIVLIASYCTTSLCPCGSCANNSQSSLIFTPCHICYRPCCHWQPHRHPH